VSCTTQNMLLERLARPLLEGQWTSDILVWALKFSLELIYDARSSGTRNSRA
jgi:hypothetical protein